MLFSPQKAIYTLLGVVLLILLLILIAPKKHLESTNGNKFEQDIPVPVQATSSMQKNWTEKLQAVDYAVYPTYSDSPLDVKLLVADKGYSLVAVQDLQKILFGTKYSVKEPYIYIKYGDKAILYILNTPLMLGYAVAEGTQKRYAQYKIPFPAVKINDKYYVPLRTTLRVFRLGVRFVQSEKKILFGAGVSVDDSNLVFDRYCSGEEVKVFEEFERKD